MTRNNNDALQEFTKYYEEFKKSIYNYLLYRVSFDQDVAEDLTAEVFIKAYEHLDSYDRKRSFKTWIFTIAHNHLINYVTSKKDVLSLDESIEIPSSDSGMKFGEEVDMQMQLDIVHDLIEQLPEAQRELLTMRFVNDLSNSEIASVMKKEEGAIRTGLSRSIASLRNLYNQHLSATNATHNPFPSNV